MTGSAEQPIIEQRADHTVFFHEEYFGSRLFDARRQEEHFFDAARTVAIKEVLLGNARDRPELNEVREDLLKRGLLTSHVVEIPRRECIGISAPVKMSLVFNKLCNLRCRHCSISAGAADLAEMTTAEWNGLIDQMRAAGTFFVTFGGGEPMMRSDLYDVIMHARDRHIAVSLVTNGVLITRENAEKLDALTLKYLTISFDGLETTHDYVRGRGTFKQAVAGMRLLKEYCPSAKLAIRVTVNGKNHKECPALVRLAEELAVDTIVLKPVLELGRIRDNKNLLVSRLDYANFLKDIRGIESSVRIQLPHHGDERKFFVEPDDIGCHYGREACWVTQRGELYPCIFFGEGHQAGSLRDTSYLELWDRAKEITRGNDKCSTCVVAVRNRGRSTVG